MSRKAITVAVSIFVVIAAVWYGSSYWTWYQKEFGWAQLPKQPQPLTDAVKVISLRVNEVSLLENNVPLVWTSRDKHVPDGEVEGDPQRWLNSLYPKYTIPDVLPTTGPQRVLQLRYRFWREGGTKFETTALQGLLGLKRKDSKSFQVRGEIRVPRRPGEYEFQIWAVERDPKDLEMILNREFGPDDHLVGRRHISVRPAIPSK